MNITVTKNEEKCEVLFNVVIGSDEWKIACDKALGALALNVTVKGFRKGKAPISMASKYIDPSKVFEKAADKKVNEAYAEIAKKEEFVPFAQPRVDIKTFNEQGLEFVFTVPSQPKVELPTYKGLKVEKKVIRVTNADIEAELNDRALKNAELIVADNDYEAKSGDTVVIDFKGYVDGKTFDGGSAKGFELALGSNTFVPGFEDQLIGVKANDDKDVIIKFPDNYVANLSGKEATFKTHVIQVKQKNVPAIDDDFAKDLDIEGVETLEQLKEKIKVELHDKKVVAEENNRFASLVKTIIEGTKFYVSDIMITADANNIIEDFKKRVNAQGFNYDDYLKMTRKTNDDILKEAKEESYNNAKNMFTFNEIAKENNITITDEEFDAKLAEIAQNYKMSVEDLKKQYPANQLNALRYNLRHAKVVEFLKKENNL